MLQNTVVNFIFSILLMASAAASENENCTPLGSPLRIFESQKEYPFDLQHAFERGWLLGQGAFGIVRSIDFGLEDIPKAAVKEIKKDSKANEELEILIDASKNGLGTKFYGCQYSEDKLYIVQELLHKDMANDHMILQFRQKPNSVFIERMQDIVKTLIRLEKIGKIHGDLKDENVMTDENFSYFRVIDFGLSQKLEEKLERQGSPVYMSPGKWSSYKEKATIRDDLYSFAVLAGVLNNENAFSTIYTDPSLDSKKQKAIAGCYVQHLGTLCRGILEKNIIRLLKRANFGNFQEFEEYQTASTINFTTLVVLMLRYDDFPFSLDQVQKILTRLAKQFRAMEQEGDGRVPIEYFNKRIDSRVKYPTTTPDTFDTNRKYFRIHPDDLNNYLFRLVLAERIDLQMEKDKREELKHRIDLLSENKKKEKSEERNPYVVDLERRQKAASMKGLVPIPRTNTFQLYQKAVEKLDESVNLNGVFHKQNEIAEMIKEKVIERLSVIRSSFKRPPEPDQADSKIDSDEMSLRKSAKELIGNSADENLSLLKETDTEVMEVLSAAAKDVKGLKNQLRELPDEIVAVPDKKIRLSRAPRQSVSLVTPMAVITERSEPEDSEPESPKSKRQMEDSKNEPQEKKFVPIFRRFGPFIPGLIWPLAMNGFMNPFTKKFAEDEKTDSGIPNFQFEDYRRALGLPKPNDSDHEKTGHPKPDKTAIQSKESQPLRERLTASDALHAQLLENYGLGNRFPLHLI